MFSEFGLYKKTNEVQSLDTPHLPKYMRKLLQRYNFNPNYQTFGNYFFRKIKQQLLNLTYIDSLRIIPLQCNNGHLWPCSQAERERTA